MSVTNDVFGAEATALLQATMPLCSTLGMRGVKVTAGEVVVELDWASQLCTGGGLLHGGAIMALADAAGAVCAWYNLPEGAAGTTTVESKTNFLAAVRGGTVTATATPLHTGSSVVVVETALRDAHGKLVAKVTQTQAVLRPRA